MKYAEMIKGEFIARPNRFIAKVKAAGEEMTVHVKNTGRCRELLLPGATVYLAKGQGPHRKTLYDLVAVKKGSLLINMDAQAPNAAAEEWLRGATFFPPVEKLQREYAFGASRLDFYMETEAGPYLLEVKGVTLEEEGRALFPDAPTARGLKHVRELTAAVKAGHKAAVLFVIQFAGARYFVPNKKTDPAFAAALVEAAAAGVEVRAAECRVTPDSMTIEKEVKVHL